MTNNTPLNRRTVLKGLGAVVALPWLESVAAAVGPVARQATSGPAKRLAFMYVPNGVIMPDWKPKQDGPLGVLPDILKPLDAHKSHLNVLSELALDKARANGDGPGDHARAMSAFLTGRQPRKTHGADIKVGISADQHVAKVVGDQTRFPSLELGIEKGQTGGNCDSGYSCAYSANLSWLAESTPNAKECDPKAVFDRLFGGNDPKEVSATRAKRDLFNKSILDFVADDTKALGTRLGQADKRKLDEYLTSVREIEQRIARAKSDRENQKPVPKPDMAAPKGGIPGDFREHIRLMMDLAVLAFQTDLTRVLTLPIANDGSNRTYKFIDVPDGHHEISHHQRNAEKIAKLKRINTFHVTQFAYFLDKLKAVKEADGSNLLDNSMIVYGSGIGDGDRHNHDDLPILLAGKGGGTITTGRHITYSKDTPLMNLYLALFERMGAPTPRFGDSTGVLKI